MDAVVKDLWENTEPRFRSQAAAALGELGPAVGVEGAQALVAAVVSDPCASVRQTAAHAIGLLRRAAGEASIGALATVLTKDTDAEVRSQAAASLGDLGAGRVGAEGIAALVSALCLDENVSVRKEAAAALEIHGAAAVQPLFDALENGGGPQAAARALSVLRSLAEGQHVDLVACQHSALLACLMRYQEDDHVRSAAVDVFVAFGEHARCSIPGLVRAARNEGGDSRHLGSQAAALEALEAMFQCTEALFHTPEGCRAASLLSLHRSRGLAAPADAPEERVQHAHGVRQAVGFLKRGPAARHRAVLAHFEGATLGGTMSSRLHSHP